MTKKQKYFYEDYIRASAEKLSDVYSSYSRAKFEAFHWCVRKMYDMNGYGGRIMGHNSMTFTYGFLHDVDGKKWLNVETRSNSYDFPIE